MMPEREQARAITKIKYETQDKCVNAARREMWLRIVESTTTAIPYNIRSIINCALVMEGKLPYP